MTDKNRAGQPKPDTHKETVLDGVLESFHEDPEKYALELVRLYSDSNTQDLFKGREREILDLIENGVKPKDPDDAKNLAVLMSELQKKVNGRQIVVGSDKRRIRSTGTAVHGILEGFDENPEIHVKYFHEYFTEHPDLFEDKELREQVVSKLRSFLASDSDDHEARAKASFLIHDFTGEEVPMDIPEDKSTPAVRPPVDVAIPPRKIFSGGISDGKSGEPVTTFGNGSEEETRGEMPAIVDESEYERETPAVSDDMRGEDSPAIMEGPAQSSEDEDVYDPDHEDSAVVNEEFKKWKAVIQTVCFNQAFPAVFEDTLDVVLDTLSLPELQERFEICDYLYNALNPSAWTGFLVIEYEGLAVKVKKECVIIEVDDNIETFDIRFFEAVKSGKKFSEEEYKVLNAIYQALYKAVLVDYERVNGFFREYQRVKEFVFSNIPDKDSLISGFWPTVFGKLIESSARLSEEQRETKEGKEYWERFKFMMEAVYGEGNWLGFQILESNDRAVYFQPGLINVVHKTGKKSNVYPIDLDEHEGAEAAEQILAEVSSDIIMKVPITRADLMKILVNENDQDTVRQALMKKVRDTRSSKNGK